MKCVCDLLCEGRARSLLPATAVVGLNLSPRSLQAFIIAFTYLQQNWLIHFLCRKGLTTVSTKEMRPFILISDGRLAIDYSGYGNLSDLQNLCLDSLSHLSLDLIFLNALD